MSAKQIGIAVIATMAVSVPAVYAQARLAPAGATKATPGADGSALMKLSHDGNVAMRDLQAARLAIFNGDPQKARDLVTHAESSLDSATKEAPTFVVDKMTGINGKLVEDSVQVSKMNMVPIDTQLSLADTFVPTPENKPHLEKANENFKTGRTKEAIAELQLARVDVSYTRALLPIAATKKRVVEAAGLLANNKFYEANLALKDAEAGVVVKTASLMETVFKPAAPAAKKT